MTVNDTPQPPERPEDEGIPDHADDTSTAFEEGDRPRLDDSPSALPADQPVALDDFGLTAQEQRSGEPLSDRIAREEPDVDEYPARESVGETVGRITEPDQGVRPDTEKDLVADEPGDAVDPDRRPAGMTAEEAAMHALPDQEVPYRE